MNFSLLTPPVPLAIRRFFALADTERFVSDVVGAQGWRRLTGTFSGFGSAVGIRGSFSRIKFYIQAWDAALIPSSVRARIRDTNSSGTVLGDATVSVSPVLNSPYLVTVDFPSVITSANPLWFEFFTNGHTGNLEILTGTVDFPMSAYPQAHFSADASISSLSSTQFIPNYPAAGSAQMIQYVGFYSLGAPKIAVLSDYAKQLMNRDYLSQILTISPGFLTVGASGSNNGSTWVNETSTFTGWGSAMGVISDFSALRIYVRGWDSSVPVTRVRARVKLNDKDGAVIADKTQTYIGDTGVASLMTFDFGTVISGGATPLWLEINTDGHFGFYKTATSLQAAHRRFWTDGLVSVPGSSSDGGGGNMWAEFGSVTGDIGSVTLKSAFAQAIGSASIPSLSQLPDVKIHLPATLYAVEGIEMNIYFKNVVRGLLHWDQYDFEVSCAKGDQYQRFWRYTPLLADAGTTNLIFRVFSNGNKLAERVCSLITKAKSVGGGATRQVVFTGDSTVADGRTVAEMMYQDALDTGLSLTFKGTITSSKLDSGGNSRTIHCQAVSGKTINYFYTDAASPFVFSGAFNWATYLSTNSITLVSNDWILIPFGINDTFNFKDDINLAASLSATLVQLDAMIAQMQAATSGVRIGILLTIPSTNQDAFANSYHATQTSWRYERSRAMWVEMWLAHFDGRTAEKIYVIPQNAFLDMDYNCIVDLGTTSRTQNALNTGATFIASDNGVHPADKGYWQLGQGIWAHLKGLEN